MSVRRMWCLCQLFSTCNMVVANARVMITWMHYGHRAWMHHHNTCTRSEHNASMPYDHIACRRRDHRVCGVARGTCSMSPCICPQSLRRLADQKRKLCNHSLRQSNWRVYLCVFWPPAIVYVNKACMKDGTLIRWMINLAELVDELVQWRVGLGFETGSIQDAL